MSTITRNLSNISGANVTNPTANNFTANGLNSYANDAAFEAVITPVAGSIYWNTTDKALREYNGATWQYDKTIFSVQTDAATTGAAQDITPNAFDQVIRFTVANTLTSIRNIVPTIQKLVYLVNDQSSQRLTITNNAGGTAANRIITGSNSDLIVEPGATIGLLYDEDATRWRVISAARPASALESFASDAAFITAHPGTLTAGSTYWNSVSNLIRQYNGAAWQNDKTSYTTQADAATTGSNQDITPSIDQIIRFTQGSLFSIRSIAPAIQQVITLVNGQASQVITLVNESAGATAANRIVTGTNSDFSLAVGQAVQLVYDSSGTRWRVAGAASAAGSSSGEVNAISNQNAASDLTGWTGATRVITGSPLDPIVATAFSIANAAAAESSTSGGYASIASLPNALRSMKNKISFYFNTPATDVYKVSVYQGATRLPLSSDSSGASILPAGVTGGFFYAYVDTNTSAAYSVNVTRTSGTTGACLITTVIFGPGIITQGAAISAEQTFAPAVAGTTSTATMKWERCGSRMRGSVFVDCSAVSATTLSVSLPAGMTIDSLALEGGDLKNVVGSGLNSNGGGGSGVYIANVAIVATAHSTDYTKIYFSALNASDASGNILGALIVASVALNPTAQFQFSFNIPIAEWASSGTVNLGAGSQVDFAYNSDVSATSSVTASGFANGPGGIAISTNWAAGTEYKRRVRFQYPIQSSDIIVVEVQSIGFGNNEWVPIDTAICGYINTSSTYKYGCQWVPVTGSQTDIDVVFADGGARPSATFGTATGTAWSVFTATYNWRVRKANASSPVGFGLASSTASGLVQPRKGQFQMTATSAISGWTTVRASGVYYQDQEGNHRLKFNLSGSISSQTLNGGTSITIAGVVFKNISNFEQPCAGYNSGTSPLTYAFTNANTGNITVSAVASASANRIGVSGDIELESKPTWA